MQKGLLGLAGLAVVWSGCNLIAGIEEGQLAPSDGGVTADGPGNDVAPTPDGAGGGGGGAGGGSDTGAGGGTGADTGGGGDAPVDSGRQVVCNWANPTPVTVVNLEGATATGRTFNGFTPIAAVGAHSAQIVQQISGDGNNFHIYTVDLQQQTSNDNVESFQNPNGRVGRPFQSKAGLGFTSLETPTAGTTLYAYTVPPTFGGGTGLPTPYAISPAGLDATQFDVETFELSAGVDFWVDTFLQNGTTSTYEVDVGTNQPAGSTTKALLTTLTQAPSLGNGGLLLYNGAVYVALGPNNPGQSATEIYAVSNTANFTGPIQPTQLGGPGFPFILGSQHSPIDTFNYDIMAGVVQADAGLTLQLFGASATGTDLASLSVATAPFTQGISLIASQIPGNTFAWLDDEFLAVGGGFGSDGINFLWSNTTGAAVVLLSGTTRLIPGHVAQEATVVGASHIGEGAGTFYISWREHGTDDAGGYDVLYANELDCFAQ